jgi:Pentapeptide repeats (8 copies)
MKPTNLGTPEPDDKREQPLIAPRSALLSTATALAEKAKDLQALRDAVVDAASISAGLWFSYLFVLFYLAVALGGVTHRDLFLANPVKLPFLNVDLPLIGFFVIGPGLFLIVHTYVLLHVALFADKVGAFHAELESQIMDTDVRERVRRQLPSNIFVQLLAGPREVRAGVRGFMLRLVAQCSLVVAPVALLVLFHLQFLAYHNEAIVWWLRFAIVADLALLWALWPSIERGQTSRVTLYELRRGKVAAASLASLFPVLFITTIATVPGEWADVHLPNVRVIPTRWPSQWPNGVYWTSLHELLIAGVVDEVSGRPLSLFSNRLVLTDQSFVDPDKLEKIEVTHSFRGRDLRQAVLNRADLRKADFTGAILSGAKLENAK